MYCSLSVDWGVFFFVNWIVWIDVFLKCNCRCDKWDLLVCSLSIFWWWWMVRRLNVHTVQLFEFNDIFYFDYYYYYSYCDDIPFFAMEILFYEFFKMINLEPSSCIKFFFCLVWRRYRRKETNLKYNLNNNDYFSFFHILYVSPGK